MGREGISQENNQEKERELSLERYYLQKYIYSADPEILKEAKDRFSPDLWEDWHIGILIESEQGFFDMPKEEIPGQIYQELRREFFYLNLNPRQSLLLFKDHKRDYRLLAGNLYLALKRRYTTRLHLAVSREFTGSGELPKILKELEKQMEEKYYNMEKHVFYSDVDETASPELQDYQIIQWISQDIGRKDVEQLERHFSCLKEKYGKNSQFSAMYVKFVFSNVLQGLFMEQPFAGERSMEKEIDRLYRCGNISQILSIIEENISCYKEFLSRYEKESEERVEEIHRKIEKRCEKSHSTKKLADKVDMEPGYLNYFFRRKYGMSLKRFLRICRMEKACRLLKETGLEISRICEETGFINESYFRSSFLEYFGMTPEECRKQK
ncbi:MAG: AraC family transcriptional regulator [Blautia sp.]|nr:AraC family transcriptional regulator [Blautia sp.]